MRGPRLRLSGVDYIWVATEVMNITAQTRDRIVIEGPREVVNICDKCHRCDVVTAKAHSWEDAIERCWLILESLVEERERAISP